jgi:hypothetical protein
MSANRFYQDSDERKFIDSTNAEVIQKYSIIKEKVDSGEWHRAGGECICHVCKKEYKRHLNLEYEFGWLTELCDGELVKL